MHRLGFNLTDLFHTSCYFEQTIRGYLKQIKFVNGYGSVKEKVKS